MLRNVEALNDLQLKQQCAIVSVAFPNANNQRIQSGTRDDKHG